MKDSLGKSGASISGGQQQRLCIARTIAVSPEVVLMDEPASALDPLSTTKIEELIYELKNRYTIVIVTHNMQQAARVSDFTAFFYLGQLIEYDETRKDVHNPGEETDGRLHHGAVRLMPPRADRAREPGRGRCLSVHRSQGWSQHAAAFYS